MSKIRAKIQNILFKIRISTSIKNRVMKKCLKLTIKEMEVRYRSHNVRKDCKLGKAFFLYAPRSFRTWSVRARHNFLYLVIFPSFSVFAKKPNIRSVVHSHKLARQTILSFLFLLPSIQPCECYIFQALLLQYVSQEF